MNFFNKRTLMTVGVAAVVIGLVRKHAMDVKNKDSFITKIAETVGLDK